ncbi:hypothetical protein KC219_21385, partial [Mycobacterium tuberculosis]|nr:hypothetical protein [Mycobacterium tuberculosis]
TGAACESTYAEIAVFFIQRYIGGFQRNFLALLVIRAHRDNLIAMHFNHFQFRAAQTRLNDITCCEHSASCLFIVFL